MLFFRSFHADNNLETNGNTKPKLIDAELNWLRSSRPSAAKQHTILVPSIASNRACKTTTFGGTTYIRHQKGNGEMTARRVSKARRGRLRQLCRRPGRGSIHNTGTVEGHGQLRRIASASCRSRKSALALSCLSQDSFRAFSS